MNNTQEIERWKYPRTPHLPYSESRTDDDKTLSSDDHLAALNEVVVTVKMDGENTTVYPDGYVHARSLEGVSHEWQNWLRGHVWNFCTGIPSDWRICGENLYAKHSIGYKFDSIEDTFQVFHIAKGGTFLSWDNVKSVCEALGLKTVPEIYRGPYDRKLIMDAFERYKAEAAEHGQEVEGFVVRYSGEFPYHLFDEYVAKYVRANHVQTDKHWRETWVKNEF